MKKSILLLLTWFAILQLQAQVAGPWLNVTSAPMPANAHVKSLFAKNNILYAGTIGNGVFVSLDEGDTWIEKNIGLPANAQVTSVLNIPGDQRDFIAINNEGVFYSNDTGSTWIPSNNGLPASPQIVSLAYIGSKLIAGLKTGNVYTLNIDQSPLVWIEQNNTLSELLVIKALEGKIYAGTKPNGIYISSDTGSTWVQSNSGISGGTDVVDFEMLGSTLFAARNLQGQGGEGKVYYSTNAGANWLPCSNLPGVDGFNGNGPGPLCLLNYNDKLYVGSDDKYAGGIHYTTDNGTTWSPVDTSAFMENDVLCMAILNGIFAGTLNKGVWKDNLINSKSENHKSNSVQIYPNPAKNIIYFDSDIYNGTTGMVLKIYSITGNVVFSKEIAGKTEVPLSSFSRGIYIYQLQNTNGLLHSGKFIVE